MTHQNTFLPAKVQKTASERILPHGEPPVDPNVSQPWPQSPYHFPTQLGEDSDSVTAPSGTPNMTHQNTFSPAKVQKTASERILPSGEPPVDPNSSQPWPQSPSHLPTQLGEASDSVTAPSGTPNMTQQNTFSPAKVQKSASERILPSGEPSVDPNSSQTWPQSPYLFPTQLG